MKHFKAIGIVIVAMIFFVLSFFFFHDVRPTMLVQYSSVKPQTQVFWDEILPKKPFVFAFTADEDNLGSVEVRFRSYKRQDNYALLFQLQEVGTTNMIYEHIYYLFPFEQERLFPFGFPVISDSRGKHYEITLSSIGSKDIPVAVSHAYPSVTAKYYEPWSQLKSHGISSIRTFVYKKAINTITNWQFILNAILFLCPITFLLYMFVFKMEVRQSMFIAFISNVILFSSLGYMVVISGYLYLYVIVCFLIAKRLFGWSYSIPLISTLLCMAGSVGALLMGKLMVAEQAAIWILPTGVSYLLYVPFEKDSPVGKTWINNVRAVQTLFLRIYTIVLVLIIVGLGYSGYNSIKAILFTKPSDKPIVSYVGPTTAYNASFVLIKGSGYGSEYTGLIRIMSTFGEIQESNWTNKTIVFRIPLEWTPGTFRLWMERRVDNNWIKVPNSEYSVNLLDKNKPWSEDDDQYYRQVTSGPDELLKASEYTMGWYY